MGEFELDLTSLVSTPKSTGIFVRVIQICACSERGKDVATVES